MEIVRQIMDAKLSVTDPWSWGAAYMLFISTIGYRQTIKYTKTFGKSNTMEHHVIDTLGAICVFVTSPIWIIVGKPVVAVGGIIVGKPVVAVGKRVNKTLCWPNEDREPK